MSHGLKPAFFHKSGSKKRADNHAGMRYGVDGDLLSESEYEKPLFEVLPDAEDERVLNEIFKDNDWVLQMN